MGSLFSLAIDGKQIGPDYQSVSATLIVTGLFLLRQVQVVDVRCANQTSGFAWSMRYFCCPSYLCNTYKSLYIK